MVWFGIVWHGLAWFGMVWYGLVCISMVWFGFVGIVWYGGGSDVFIHEEISIMDYNGLSRTIIV